MIRSLKSICCDQTNLDGRQHNLKTIGIIKDREGWPLLELSRMRQVAIKTYILKLFIS